MFHRPVQKLASRRVLETRSKPEVTQIANASHAEITTKLVYIAISGKFIHSLSYIIETAKREHGIQGLIFGFDTATFSIFTTIMQNILAGIRYGSRAQKSIH